MKVLTKILTIDDVNVEDVVSGIKAGRRVNAVVEDSASYGVCVYDRMDDNTWQKSSWWENPDYEGNTTAKSRADEYLVGTGYYPRVGTTLETTTEVINEVIFDIFGYHNGKVTILVDVI
jgi:hypothetical protein